MMNVSLKVYKLTEIITLNIFIESYLKNVIFIEKNFIC